MKPSHDRISSAYLSLRFSSSAATDDRIVTESKRVELGREHSQNQFLACPVRAPSLLVGGLTATPNTIEASAAFDVSSLWGGAGGKVLIFKEWEEGLPHSGGIGGKVPISREEREERSLFLGGVGGNVLSFWGEWEQRLPISREEWKERFLLLLSIKGLQGRDHVLYEIHNRVVLSFVRRLQ